MRNNPKAIFSLPLATATLMLVAHTVLGNAVFSTRANAVISADTAGGGYTAVSGPVLDEGGTQDINAGSIILQAPAGFAFDPTATVTAAVVRTKGTGSTLTLSSGTAAVTTSTVTITVTSADGSGGGTRARITWSGIRVRPIAGTPLASGNITLGGTATIKGLSSSASAGALAEVPGVVTALAFTTQPGNATAGTPFGTQPVIQTQDQFGNNSTNGLPAVATVTLSLTSGAGPLQGSTALNLGTAGGRGTATYSGLRIDVAGTDKQLSASSSLSLAPVLSSIFSVSPGPASQLVLAAQPSATAGAGVAFAQQPVVLIEDAYNNVRSNDALVVTAVRQAGAGNLMGTTNVAAVNGVATFTDLAHAVATNITIGFRSGALTQAFSSAVTISAGPFVQLQALLPGEIAAPGTTSGKTGSAVPVRQGTGFAVTVNGTDVYWNQVGSSDLVHLNCSDSASSLPADLLLSGGVAVMSLTNNTLGGQTLTVSDLSNPGIGSSTVAYTVYPPGASLAPQPDRAVNELSVLVVTNTALNASSTNGVSVGSLVTTNRIIFNYTNRDALLADGWSFIATAADGTPRNTEITNPVVGAVVSYDQSAHAGVLRIPCDVGDLWANNNTSRNSLFRNLPTNWVSLRLALAFAPTTNYQQVHLALYQNDDNFIQSGMAHNDGLGGEVSTLVWELNAVPDHFVTPLSGVTSLRLRLDREPGTGTISGYYSLDGATWNLLGSQNVALVNPRLGIWVGGSPVPHAPGMPVCDLQQLEVVSSNSAPAGVLYQLVNAPAGASIDGNGVISWTPSEAQGPGTNVITTVATDYGALGGPATCSNSFTVVVNEVNSAPVLPAQANRVVGAQTTLLVNNAAVDTDIPANSLTYQLVGAPTNASISAAGVITWTPTPDQVPSTNVFTTVVADFNPWAINAQRLSATNSFTVFALAGTGQNGPVLLAQAARAVNESTPLVVTNTALENLAASQLATNSYPFSYTDRNALVGAGWTFLATLPSGAARNTEITNPAVGAVVSYDQAAHPGVLRVPCDLGDLWAASNNSRNSLFRSLPTNWVSARLALAFAPNANYQQVHLALYQDDDNYVEAGCAFNGTEKAAMDQEVNGSPTTAGVANLAASTVQLRLDRDPVTGNVAALYSTDGTSWVTLQQVAQALVNPRLCIWVGGAQTAYTNGMPVCDLQRLDVVVSNTGPTAVSYQLVSAPAGAAIDANGVITWTPAEAQGPSTNVLTTVATDNGQPPLSATNSFTVVVNEVNQAPVLPNQPNHVLNGQTPLLVTNTATDADIPLNTLTYQLVAAPANATIDANGVISWTPTLAQVPSTNVFVTVATDFNPWAVNAQHLSATNQFTVTVLNGLLLPPGSANSQVPIALSYDAANNVVALSFKGTPGLDYQVVWTSELNGTWSPLATVTADEQGQVSYSGPAPAATAFFRVLGP